MSATQERRERFTRTKKQRQFRRLYWDETGFEFLDDTREPFADVARRQLNWYLTQAQEVHRHLEDEFMNQFDNGDAHEQR